MKILHITPHLGGGVGTVIIDWMNKRDHCDPVHVLTLDYANEKAKAKMKAPLLEKATYEEVCDIANDSDIVLVHYWDHPMLADLFSKPLPPCRLIFWCHKNTFYPLTHIMYPDRFIETAPVREGAYSYIKSTGNMERFLEIRPKEHDGFNIGTVISKKMDVSRTFDMFNQISGILPDAHFIWIGDAIPVNYLDFPDFNFIGKVDDIAPWMALMDVFAYPLKNNHYGTSEIVLGEAMCAGVPPVTMENQAEKFIIDDGVNGYCEPSTEDFIDAIKFLHDTPDHRMRMGRNARRRAKLLYSIDRMIDHWNQVFEELMKEPKKERKPI